MKIRLRFTKTGSIRFVGHLDFMRTFQKAVKKSGLPAVYTSGFNPHMLLSFAAPLGVGEETAGDYADIEFAFRDMAPLSEHDLYRMKDIGLDNEALPLPPPVSVFCGQLNAAMPPGVRITGAARVGQTRDSKAMSLVRYASWQLLLKDSFLSGLPAEELNDMVLCFLAEDHIMIHKKTKKSEKEVDIRPMIRSMSAADLPHPGALSSEESAGVRSVLVTCSAGSSENLKPAAVMDAFCRYTCRTSDPNGFRTVRRETYNENLETLLSLGSSF